MTRRSIRSEAPIEVVCEGLHPDRATLDWCLAAAREFGSLEACRISIRDDGGGSTRIQIELRTAGGDLVVDRVAETIAEWQLCAALRRAFAQVAHALGHDARDSTPRVAPQRDEEHPPDAEPPACTWYG